MAKRKKKIIPKPGDVIEINLNDSFAYTQFIGYHINKFAFIRVFQGIFDIHQVIENVSCLDEQFQSVISLNYELNYNDSRYYATIIGNVPIPETYKIFPIFKTYDDFGNNNIIWYLEYGDDRIFSEDEWVHSRVKNLREIGRELPLEYYEYPTSKPIDPKELRERIMVGATNSYDVYLFKKWAIQAEEEIKQAAMKEKSELNENVSTNISISNVRQTRTFTDTEFNPLEKILTKLLNRLDSIAEKYEDIFDTAVREEMFSVVYHSFVLLEHDYKLPESFGMFSKAGNKRIFTALSAFIKDVQLLVEKEECLQTNSKRLDAFQDDRIQSKNGTTYDEYFGEMEELNEK
jgi:hypothetical protein